MSLSALVPHFLRPEWGWALLGLPLLLWAWRRRRQPDDAWRDAVDPHLLPALLESGAGSRRPRGRALWLGAYLLAIAALAGPAWDQQPATQWQMQAPLVVAIELSRGMLAADLPPSRLQRARLKLAQLLDERAGGQVALVAYAGEAFTVAPLTEDARTVRALLDPLDPALMPVEGRRADRAIVHAQDLIRGAGFERGDILLLASGSEGEATAAARAAAEAGMRVSVIGVGTREGAPVRDEAGGFVAGDGGLQLWRLQESDLRALAAAGGGAYAELRADASDLRAVGALDPRGEQRIADDAGAHRWQDAGYWLIVPLMLAMLVAFRRGGFAAALLMVALLPRPATAIDWAALWQRGDQRAHAALQASEHERARELAEDPDLAAAAAYRLEDWEAAAERWAQRDDARAHYNRGNALAKAGRYEEALSAYDEALRRDPQFADAVANRQAVQEWLERQPQEPGEGGDGQPQSGEQPQGEPSSSEQPPEPSSEGESDESGEDASASEGEPSEESGESRDGGAESSDAGDAEAAESEDTADAEAALREAMQQALEAGEAGEPGDTVEALDPAAEEQRRALEQWLRRVPDDPGGLLRRKFLLEHQRRQMEQGAVQ